MDYKPGLTEIEIVSGCLENNRKSQKMLFDRYKDAMYTIAFRILRDEDLASDALQEGFISVFESLKNFKGHSTLGAWIKTIMVRSTLRILNQRFETANFETEFVDETITWDENLTGESLDKAIASLSPGYRSVFVLIEVEGYSHKEVAEMLNISEGTSKSQLSRAKKLLQEKLKHLIE
ncbi:MAG: RNA polymerase sigma factor [Bacteroidales bacterium]|jgi:RNA polymerase sigma-70 factor (ECF subfamily)